MISGIVPFYEIIENLKDDTSYTNLTSYYERIRRFIFRAEQQIGYSGAIVFKKVPYTNDTTNFNGTRLFFPSDFIEFYGVTDEKGTLTSQAYRIQRNKLTFCDGAERNNVSLFYYGLLCDGEGNPITTRSHLEAVLNFIKWKLFGAKAFLYPQRGIRNNELSYKQEWEDSRDAAQGNDAFPGNEDEWALLGNILSMSTKDAMIYYAEDNLECACVEEMKSDCVLKETEIMIDVYTWQYDNKVDSIANAPAISNESLDLIATKRTLKDLLDGIVIPYNNIGRFGFALQGGEAGQYRIFDTLNQDVTDVVFETYYNELLKLDIYISKEFYSHSNIFWKFKPN